MQNTNVSINLTEHIYNSAQSINVQNNQTKHMQNTAQEANVTNSQHNTYKTLRETPTYNCYEKSYQKVRKTLE